jgi:uncharacterized protein YlxP (DUF503 family)
MVVGVCRISLLLEDSQSLKDKRSTLRRIKDRVSQKFNCAIAEVGDPEVWQSAHLGFAVVSNERGFTQSMVQKILTFIDDLAIAKLMDDEQDYIDYGDGVVEGGSSDDYVHWEPDEPSPPKAAPTLRLPVKLAAAAEESPYPWDSPEPPAPADPAEPASAASRSKDASDGPNGRGERS